MGAVSTIKQKIVQKGRGAIFGPKDFLDLGSRASVDQALARLSNKGVIRRISRGLYDYPKTSTRYGTLSPSLSDIAKVIAHRDGHVLQPSPAMAANLTGVSDQVPAKIIYMTDGNTRSKKIGNQAIWFRRAAPKTLVGAGQKTGLIFQTLRYVGKDRVDSRVIAKLARGLSDKDRDNLLRQSRMVPDWMRPIVKRIVADSPKH